MRLILPSDLYTVSNGIEVRLSNIREAGNGLFATRSFRRGEYITLYDGEIISRREAWSRSVKTHMASREGIFVDGLKQPILLRGGGSFANSSNCEKDANASICANLGKLVVRAQKNVEIDEEILVFYGRRGMQIASC